MPGPTYNAYWRGSRELQVIEKYVERTLNGVEQDRIVSISHAAVDIGHASEAIVMYSVLITVRNKP